MVSVGGPEAKAEGVSRSGGGAGGGALSDPPAARSAPIYWSGSNRAWKKRNTEGSYTIFRPLIASRWS